MIPSDLKGGGMLSRRRALFGCAAVLAATAIRAAPALAQTQSIVVASTTSTHDSGLFAHLLPLFTRKTGITVTVLAQGTGEALDTARRGQADVVFTHARFLEMRFVAEGFGVKRLPVMYNDFVLVGPRSDPAGIKGKDDVAAALRDIMDRRAPFISRGDRSATHMTELMLWNRDAGVNIEREHGDWYKAARLGMEATLEAAAGASGYALTDRGSWLNFKKRGELEIVIEGDRRLFNQYAVVLVNPERHPQVKKELGQSFIDWLLSREGQKAIADFKIEGEPLFYPNATDPNA
jgi:tungstate transport system substrate-binding protein